MLRPARNNPVNLWRVKIGKFKLLLMSLLLAAHAAAAGDTHLDFEVFLDAKPVGTHQFDIQNLADGTQTIRSVAVFDVKILGLFAYRYHHQASETWKQGCLARMDASTDDNGRKIQVSGGLHGDSFQLDQPKSLVREGCIISYAYWDPAILLRQRELLNPGTGQFDAVQIDSLGEQTIVSRGADVKADHYRLRNGNRAIDLWYSQAGEWLQLDSTTPLNRTLHYRRK
ncbi:MAG: DUF6134 family protein [Pseudomonadota bacterium]